MWSDRDAGDLAALVGYRVLGRLGDLGVVTEATRLAGAADLSILIVRGGVSRGLRFEVPATRVREVAHQQRTLVVDADIVDFVPRLTEEGDVELRLDA